MRQKNLLILAAISSVVFSLVVVGCSKKEEPNTAVSQPAASAPTPQAPPQPGAQPVAQPATQTPHATANPALTQPPAAVVASADGEKAGLRVEVTELKRTSGGTISLKFVMYNDSADDYDIEDKFIEPTLQTKDRYDMSGVHLIDAANKKKYLVVQDSEQNCVCSRGLKRRFSAKSRMNLWAKFPAPPEDVQKIGVVLPHFQPMDDVPISR